MLVNIMGPIEEPMHFSAHGLLTILTKKLN